ncbi:MAG: ABC transporter permease [Coriobacteriales bacterium]|nr:ABC transporter permease [Coriobacteriales bacterium]
MKFRDLAVETASALDANRGRSALTVLGIVIGIAAVIAMTSLISGINKALVSELGLSQAQLVNIGVYTGQSLTYDDVDAFARDLSSTYEYMVASSSGSGEITTGQKKSQANIKGVKPQYFKAMSTKFVQGRAFTEAEEQKGAMVVILQDVGVKKLFGNAETEVTGKTVRIGNNEYTIVGVTEGGQSYGDESVELYMPFSTAATRITGNQEVSEISGFAPEGSDMDAVVAKTQEYLYQKYNLVTPEEQDYVYVSSMKSMIDSVHATMGSFSLLMSVVASVSRLVGGIGIMNMMLTNVTERIREIGLRKALGAHRSDITKQFMLESVCLCLVGGLLGVLLGYVGALALAGLGANALLGEGSTTTVTPVIDGGTVLMATVICVGIGLVFGWYPAYRAAKLDPVESLHYQ